MQQYTKLGIIGTMLLGAACSGGDTTAPIALTDARRYWQLTLNHHAATLSVALPYDTLQLVATSLTADGAILPNAAPVTFSVVGNDTSVNVSTSGLVTAHSPKSSVQVVASKTIGELTLKDTLTLRVNAVTTFPRLTTFSIQPASGDSAKTDGSGIFPKTLTTRVLDAGNATIPNVVTSYLSADSTIATVNRLTGAVSGRRPGQVTLYAETNVYGVTKTDSLRFTIGLPLFAYVNVVATALNGSQTPGATFAPTNITIGVGGVIGWFNASGQPIDVVFDDPTAAHTAYRTFVFAAPSGSGNIPTFASGSLVNAVRTRWFTMAGTYKYHSTLYGTSGTVIVR